MVSTKLKPVLPSLREKKRYIVFEIISRENISNLEAVSNAVMNCVLQLVGILGAAKAGIIVLGNKWNSQLQRGVIRTSNKHVEAVKASLSLINKIDSKDVIIKTIGVSGILRKAEAKYLKVP